ncbi:MAG: hypothetical protein C0594_16535 [Marinilabiliales bacterium]|nr:MAG: hypothetical protein C0594_16535 [Marinilabiliales bacterium]
MRFISLVVLSVLVFSGFRVFGQSPQVRMMIDTNLLLIGDQAVLSLEYEGSVDQKYQFPFIEDTIASEVEIIEDQGFDTLTNIGGIIKLRKNYLITSFDTGVYVLPPQAFISEKLNDTLYTNPVPVQVFTVPVDTTSQKIYDIKEPLKAPLTFKEWIQTYYPYILYPLLVILGAVLLYYYIRKKKKNQKQPVKKVIPKEPPHIIALRDLQLLKEKKLWQAGKLKEYHSELTDIVRNYIEYRFDIQTMERTSFEILSSIKNAGIVEPQSYERLTQILTTADFVKFAKATPLPDENDASMRNAIEFVEETKLKKKFLEEEKNEDTENISKDEVEEDNDDENKSIM